MLRWLLAPLALVACTPPTPCADASACGDTELCYREAPEDPEGVCVEALGRTYDIILLGAALASTSSVSGVWDADSPPDPYAVFGFVGGDVCATTTVQDSLTAEWNEYCTFQIVEGGVFAIEVYDEDPDATMDGFAGGWSWETDAELVELVRELDVARSFVDPTASVEVYWAVTPSVR